MKGPSLQKTAAVSAGLHMMFVLLSVLVLRQSRDMIMPSPYIVSLVGPAGTAQKARAESGKAAEPKFKAKAAEKEEAAPKAAEKKVKHTPEKTDQELINESLSAIEAKRKLANLARLKRELVSIQGKGAEAAARTQASAGAAGASAGAGGASYIDKVTSQIHEYWQWPGYAENNLEAIIAVRIQSDGSVTVIDFEKRSGNRLFDKLALRAIEKASPVAAPPYEMDIGIRFYP